MSQVIEQARITHLEAFNQDVFRVLLETEQPPEYQAGQYLEIGVPENGWAPFSIACAPGASQLELHIQYLPGRETSEKIQQQLQVGQCLKLRLASGACVLPEQEQPLVLVAAGTGYAQMKALLEETFKRGWQAPIHLYWGAREPRGLYALQEARGLAEAHNNLTLIPCVELPSADWAGRTGSLVDALAEDFISPESAQAVRGFMSGSPAMVYAVEDFMSSRGMPAKALLSDVHAYAPRS